MKRSRFYDLRISRLPEALGLCKADVLRIAQYVNAAQTNLVQAAELQDEGWWGSWAEIAFTVSQTSPYWTGPREVARLEMAAVCNNAVPIYNQFFEYLQFGNGRFPKIFRQCHPQLIQVFSRNSVPLFVDLPTGPQYIQVYPSDQADVGKRVMLSGLDGNDVPIYTQDGLNPVNGQFVPILYPFSNAGSTMNSITGVQKDVTSGQVKFYALDPTTGVQVLLLTMQPNETTAGYRRYYFNGLPTNCCANSANSCTGVGVSPITVTAIVKLDLVPVQADTDYCLIQSEEAIINECQAIRYSDMDTATAKALAINHHRKAITLLNGQLIHYLGAQKPAVNFQPFGSARLANKKIGSLI